MSPSKIKGGEALRLRSGQVSPLAPASSPQPVPERSRRAAAVSSATPLSGGAPRNAPATRLGDLCSLIVDCPHSTPVWTDSGKIVLRSQNIRNGKLDLSTKSFTDEAHFVSRNRRAKPQVNDLVITREAPMGEVCILPKGLECCLGQRMVLLRPNSEKVVATYLLFALQSTEVQHQIMWSEGTGSTVSNLRIPHLEALKIPTPPIPIQKAIAHILGTLDDRIELCRRMNETLEAMARALFKDWFIDFGPVRAKMEGREPPGLSPEIAALFPSKLIDSELGEIPEGWECGSILKLARLLSGGTPKTSELEYWDGEIPWASAKDVSQCGQGFLIQTERTITKRGLEESSTKMIPALSTVVVARGATTGRLTMFGIDMAMNQTCYGLYSRIGTPFSLYCHSKHFMESMVLSAHGSVFDTITTGTFEATPVLLPSVSSLKAFEQQVTPHFEQILTNLRKVASLSTLRDTLLPKLLSGELSIPEAMLQVEAMG